MVLILNNGKLLRWNVNGQCYIGASDNTLTQFCNYSDVKDLIGTNGLKKYVYTGSFSVAPTTVVPVPIVQTNDADILFTIIDMSITYIQSQQSVTIDLYNNSLYAISSTMHSIGSIAYTQYLNTPDTTILIGANTHRVKCKNNGDISTIKLNGTNYFLYNGGTYSTTTTCLLTYTSFYIA